MNRFFSAATSTGSFLGLPRLIPHNQIEWRCQNARFDLMQEIWTSKITRNVSKLQYSKEAWPAKYLSVNMIDLGIVLNFLIDS